MTHNKLQEHLNKTDRKYFIIQGILILFWITWGSIIHFVLSGNLIIELVLVCGLWFHSDYIHRITLRNIDLRIGKSIGKMETIRHIKEEIDKTKVKK